MTTNENQAEFDPIESLLPWYASGTLASEEIPRVERALAAIPELQRRYDLIIEERAAAVAVNQTLGAPSPRAVEKLFARLENAPAGAPKSTTLRSRKLAGCAVFRLAAALAGVCGNGRGPGRNDRSWFARDDVFWSRAK